MNFKEKIGEVYDKTKELSKKAFESTATFTQESIEKTREFTREQLEARRLRLEDPVLQNKILETKNSLKEDLKNVCSNGIEAMFRFVIMAPLKALWEGGQEAALIAAHNMDPKNKKKQKSYADIPAAMIVALLGEWSKGTKSTVDLAVNGLKTTGGGLKLGYHRGLAL